ncbi:hypothetical protein [Solemya velum gill symbiont]|uniref:hypothetical protein n=1 Tax=Solemya velum gill symbiont TaxID=2340 RepID=UPI0009972855|nr:hypothetical protein [Solemya velum gill symbiont]OOZ42998.1 hypothetical protein BOW37_12530 [Solemya velum gill symbiont]OOZ47040.1 hypothetical protein BOW38_04255 [Solemya velum gill symbiont]OOZ52140.1 hypothetical protein BOW40_03580 [Solemya velum gill symbiont]OOZ54995.1 hypothetical protein BOW41_04805 [Solemya velum gill symbiont]OOZ56656.1 hypothetical protein BOW42_06040 [Solemya velum gill symbiont]
MKKNSKAPLLLNIIYAVCFCLTDISSALADDAPTTGFLYNTKETHSIQYQCELNNRDILDCEFTQTAVRKKGKPEDLDVSLKQAREEFKSGVKIPAEECKLYTGLVDILEGRKKPPNEQGFSEITDINRADLLKTSKAMKNFCTSKKEEDFLNFVRLIHEKDLRTCKVSSHTFKQSFKMVQDNLSGVGSWVAQGEAEGPCGIVSLSRFEPERLKDYSLVLWKYISRKAVTNPKGELLPGASCKNLDESEYIYDWRSKEHSLGCDYIEFSVL